MDEPVLSFAGVTLTPQKETVRVFYKELWDHADKRLVPQIFHEGFTFRGSLGPTLVGMPIFAFEGAKVRDLYVLGDIHGLIGRLKG